MILKTFNDGTPNEAFGYDGKDEYGNALSPSVTNAVGRLSHTSNQTNTAANYSYDQMGRTLLRTVCLPTDCSYGKRVVASYDLAGNMKSMTYPDGRTVTQSFDTAGRMSSVDYTDWNGAGQSSNYLSVDSAAGYDAAGHLVKATMGNGVGISSAFDNRERVQSLSYGPTSAPLWSKQYGVDVEQQSAEHYRYDHGYSATVRV